MERPLCPASSRGFSLVEVIFSLAAISILISGVASFFNTRFKEQRILSVQNAKSLIVHSMENAISDPLNIKASYEKTTGPYGPNNQIFNSCLFGTCPKDYLSPPSWQANGTLETRSQKQILGLFSSDGNGNYSSLSGKWSEDGANNCLKQDFLSCPYFVRVFFWFQCDAAPTSKLSNGDCRETTQVYMMSQILPSDPAEAKRRNLALYYPGNRELVQSPQNFAYVMSTSELRGLIRHDCATNQFLESYDSKGRAQCKCINNKPFLKDASGNNILDALGRPQCQASDICPVGSILDGYYEPDPTTGIAAPKCVPYSNSGICYQTVLESGITDCHSGYSVSHIEYGTCIVREKVAKDKKGNLSQEELECGADKATCCPRVN